MTALLRCLPLCPLPRHLPKTLPQQERQQFYRSRKLVGGNETVAVGARARHYLRSVAVTSDPADP